MKKILFAVGLLLIAQPVRADTVTTADLMGLGMPAELATLVASISTGDASFDTVTSSGDITCTATGDIGWSVVAGANTACNTTCTNACVFGVNTAATEADIVDCADATADECLCAGAS